MSNIDYSLQQRMIRLENDANGSGGPPSNGGEPPMDSINERVAKLEVVGENTVKTLDAISKRIDDGFKDLRSDLREIRIDGKSDFRWVVGIQITTLLAILGVLAKAAQLF